MDEVEKITYIEKVLNRLHSCHGFCCSCCWCRLWLSLMLFLLLLVLLVAVFNMTTKAYVFIKFKVAVVSKIIIRLRICNI